MSDPLKILAPFKKPCPACGRIHGPGDVRAEIGSGVIDQLPEMIGSLGKKPFVLADSRTFEAAGKRALSILKDAGIPWSLFIYKGESLAPDERSMGSAVMHFDYACDCILAVGSGTVNDLAKLLSRISGRPFMLLGTAPSMDGFASSSSSMIRDGLKISLESIYPQVILCDTDILKEAPLPMLQAGMGDMIAKYTSICEWRISNLVTGEYYCPAIADLIRNCIRQCTDHAEGLRRRDPEAVEAVTEGLILAGLAMTMAGCSRPASGMEHYFSHIWDMRAQEFGTASDLHGIQCGTAELICARIYERILQIKPDREKALASVKSFRYDHWKIDLRAFLGKSADQLVLLEEKEGKYDPAFHSRRLEKILDNWDRICGIIREEVPSPDKVRDILIKIGAPASFEELGHTSEEVRTAFYMTADIRDKYIGSRLLWDLGLLYEIGQELFPDERPVAYFTDPWPID
jgi:glycerol-1-phosphate dehydrogenase [NAD(P)+]